MREEQTTVPEAPRPANERQRLETLRSYQVLDESRIPGFDRAVELAGEIFATPIALVSLIDEERQVFKACMGIGANETPRSQAFCAYAIHSDDVLCVPDATKDERFADNPLVTGEPGIRFYAGAPLIVEAGVRLGTLCVIDTRPRAPLNASEERMLKHLAGVVASELNLAAENRKREEAERDKERLIRELDHRFANLLGKCISIVSMTARTADNVEDLKNRLIGRFNALGAAQRLIKAGDGNGAPIGSLVRAELKAYRGEETEIAVNGPALHLSSDAAARIALIVHELATNAAKYGALSEAGGRLDIEWSDGAETFDFGWRETPPFKISRPGRQGFGSRLIESVAGELGLTSDIVFAPDGLKVRFSGPMDRIAFASAN